MTLLGSKPIWYEPFGELVVRWFQRQPEELRHEIGGAPEATMRAETRANRLIEYCAIQQMRKIKTPREWETRWEAKEAWQRLATHLDRLGWDVIRARGEDKRLELAQTVLAESDRKTIIIPEHELRAQVEAARAGGCLVPMTEEDFAPIALCYEVYDIESQRLGRAPKAWVDELARPEFCKRLLGLPVHPLVLRLVD